MIGHDLADLTGQKWVIAQHRQGIMKAPEKGVFSSVWMKFPSTVCVLDGNPGCESWESLQLSPRPSKRDKNQLVHSR